MARKVLVLEDESSIRGFIVINLTRAGYEVIESETGEEALEKLKDNPDIAADVEEQVRANAYKLMSKQSQTAAKAAGRAVDVSADDFDDGAPADEA